MDEADAGRAPGAAGPAVARRIPSEVWRAREDAGAILARARDDAAALRAEAAADAERIRARARAEAEAARVEAEAAGREAGIAEGQARAAAEVLRGAAERRRILDACAADALDLAVAMARRLLEREVRSPEDAVASARRALALGGGPGPAVLRARPEEAEAVRGAASAWASGAVEVVADPALAPGEVVLRAGCAAVDATFRAGLARLRRAVEEEAG